ncbi:MAG: serine/threonine protein kinase, partial [Polyangiaceae bacterium]|nr:serine/threonine protein kinase [Polyangiaceae bacterium]
MTAPSAPGAPPESFVGRTLGGRYRLVRLLGSGGMGSVYEAEQLDLRRVVAVKVMRGRFDSVDLARFRVEAETTARLGHPHIVTVIEFIDASPEPALVMELLRGRSVSGALKQRLFSPEQAITIARQVLSALAAAHRSGVVHRDIKPANVFLVDGTAIAELAKVLDFGVAKVADIEPLSAQNAMVGTPAYMAPEQVLRGLVDARTDVYGVGGLLYAMLSGRPPVDTRGGVVAAVTVPPLNLGSLVPGLSPELVSIVHRALEKAPAARFESADEMSSALARLQGGVSTVPGGALGPPLHLPPPTAPTLVSQPTFTGPPSSPSGRPPSFSPSLPYASTHLSPQPQGGGFPAQPMPPPWPTDRPARSGVDGPLGSAMPPPPRKSSPWVPILLVALALVTVAGLGLAAALVVVSRDAGAASDGGGAITTPSGGPDGSVAVAINPGDAGGRSDGNKSRIDAGSGR